MKSDTRMKMNTDEQRWTEMNADEHRWQIKYIYKLGLTFPTSATSPLVHPSGVSGGVQQEGWTLDRQTPRLLSWPRDLRPERCGGPAVERGLCGVPICEKSTSHSRTQVWSPSVPRMIWVFFDAFIYCDFIIFQYISSLIPSRRIPRIKILDFQSSPIGSHFWNPGMSWSPVMNPCVSTSTVKA